MPEPSVLDAVAELQAGRCPRDVLISVLGDASLEIFYRLESLGAHGETRWIDVDGRVVAEPAETTARALAHLDFNREPIGAVLYDRERVAEPRLIEELASTAGLAFQADRLQAELRREVRVAGALTETAPSLLSHVDTDGRIMALNAAALEASGFASEEEVVGRYFWEVFIDESEREAMVARFEAAAPDFPPSEYENTFTNARGERTVIYWRSSPVLDEDGTVVSIVGGGLDITDRYRLEEAKERERVFLNAIANNAPSLLSLIDEKGVVQDRATNIAFEKALEYRPEDTGGHVFWERYVDAADADEVRERIQAVIGGEEPAEHDNVWRTSSGKRLHVAWTCTPLPRVDERELYLVSGADVGERRSRELELQRARDFLQAVVTTIPSLLVVVDHEAHIAENGVNREFSSTFGWSIEEAKGRSFLELVHPEDNYSVLMAIAAAANGVARTDLEARWLSQDGNARVVAWTASPARDRDGRGRVLLTGMDITERKRAEEELRASRARLLEAESRGRRQLERNLHDGAQQRLVALSVQLRLVETKLRQDPDTADELLEGARAELAQALEELRELARGIHPAVLTDRGLGPALESLAGRATFPVELDVPADRLPPSVEAAAYYVVSEALTNVAKYAQASSAVVRVTHDDESLDVYVSDDGVGGADAAAGSGLRGLTDRVEALDGTLRVASPSGGGTTVHATIPLVPQAQRGTGSAEPLPA